MILAFMNEDLNEVKQNPDGLEELPSVDDKDPTLKTYARRVKTDAKGNSVYRTEFVSAICMPSDYHLNEWENFPSSGNTSTTYMRDNWDAQSGDERGHLIPSALSGPPKAHNMVPQTALINRNVGQTDTNGSWYKNEREMINYLKKQNGFIRYEVRPMYADGNSGRPTTFKWMTVYYDKSGTQIRSSSGSVTVSH